jgi:transposase-like protein
MRQSERDIRRKPTLLRYAEEFGNVSLACRHFGISRQCFYIWKRAYEKDG